MNLVAKFFVVGVRQTSTTDLAKAMRGASSGNLLWGFPLLH